MKEPIRNDLACLGLGDRETRRHTRITPRVANVSDRSAGAMEDPTSCSVASLASTRRRSRGIRASWPWRSWTIIGTPSGAWSKCSAPDPCQRASRVRWSRRSSGREPPSSRAPDSMASVRCRGPIHPVVALRSQRA
jgi:hypothetical protein